MANQEKFNVTVAAFEALLKKNELRSAYLINFSKSHQISNSEGIYNVWKEWALKYPPCKWVACAFFWSGTPETQYAWRELDYEWLIWITRNLNK